MSFTEALALMRDMVGTRIDGGCFGALQRSIGRIAATLAA
jgi:hypothetical protein